jgi:signal transduction histidine kinase
VGASSDDIRSAGTEQELARIGKLVALGQIAPGVIHEINNPLFAILGLLEFLLADAEPGTKTHQRLVLMQQSGMEIKDIVRAILDFSRERDGDEPVDLGEVVHDAVALYQRTSVARDIELYVTESEEGIVVAASPAGIKVIMLNLLTNAEQALSSGGRIEVALARDGSDAVVTVSDNGEGVPPELATRVFEPYFTTRQERNAAGLGLPIARAVAGTLAGDLVLASDGGRAARFELRLPAD